MNTSIVSATVGAVANGNAMTQTLNALAGSIYVVLIALPGYWLAILTVDRLGRYPLQVGGFVAEAVLFGILAAGAHAGVLSGVFRVPGSPTHPPPSHPLPQRTTPRCAPAATAPGFSSFTG